MPACPLCNTELGEQDFGLIDCPGCGASLMIDLDGSVESSDGAVTDSPNPGPPPLDQASLSGASSVSEDFSQQLMDDLGDEASGEADRMLQDPDNWQTEGVEESEGPDGLNEMDTPTGSGSYSTGDLPDIGEGTVIGDHDFDDPEGMQAEGSGSQVYEEPEGYAEEEGPSSVEAATGEYEDVVPEESPQEEYDDLGGHEEQPEEEFDDPGGEESAPEHYDGEYEPGGEVATSGGEASVDEIGEYANSDSSQKGAIRYNVQVGHIDSKEVREEVRAILADKRLMLDVDEILSGMHNGRLEILELPAVKAYVVLSQLIGVAVSLEWSQLVDTNP